MHPPHNYRFSLDRSSKKFQCPACNKLRFVRYKDNQRGTYLPSWVGKCDRINSCGYHYAPRQFFGDNPEAFAQEYSENWRLPAIEPSAPADNMPVDFIPKSFVYQTFKNYEQNNFVIYLKQLFAEHLTQHLVDLFHIGTANRWHGANIFWQIDVNGNVRQAKIMLYHPNSGNRVKEAEEPEPGKSKILFAGKKILQQQGITQPNLRQCFFGEHQLTSASLTQPIAIVESEKTAILMTAVFPKFIWLATGGVNGCKWTNYEIHHVLTDRTVIFYPDLGCYAEWREKAAALNGIAHKVVVSDLLERYATASDQSKGYDLADFFIQKDLTFGWAMAEGDFPVFWNW